jgi:hypothetical protein
MEKYKNLAGNSRVVAYEIGRDHIKVRFRDDSVFLYNYVCPGRQALEEMKTLALRGQGLFTFIHSRVSNNYAARVK